MTLARWAGSFMAAGVATVGAYVTAKYGWPAFAVATTTTQTVAALPPPPRASPAVVALSSAPELDNEPWTGVLLTPSLDLTARVETRVKSISFRVGDEIRLGQVIAELDTAAQQHEIAAAAAAVRVSQAEAWRAGVSVSQARDRESRRTKVFRVGGTEMPLVSAEELSDSKFNALAAGAQAGAAAATAEERRAHLAYLQQIVSEATLRAPFDGVLATRYVEVGAHVRPGMPVVRVVGRGAMRVRFAVPETEVKGLALQTRVAIEEGGRTLEGTIDRIAPEVESASSSIVMEAIVETSPTNGEERSALAGRVVAVRRR